MLRDKLTDEEVERILEICADDYWHGEISQFKGTDDLLISKLCELADEQGVFDE